MKKELNKQTFSTILKKSADVLILDNPAIDYDSDTDPTDQYQEVALAYIEAGMGTDQVDELCDIRAKFYKMLKSKYGVSTAKLTSFADPTVILKEKNVPQRTRVMLGTLDLLIGKLIMADMTVINTTQFV